MSNWTASSEGPSASAASLLADENTPRTETRSATLGDQIDTVAAKIRRQAIEGGIDAADYDAWNAVGNRIRSEAWWILFAKCQEYLFSR